ncbi:MAG: 8-amino-7-oxononanoate synthase [Thermodesulfobacteriota bacterium]
MNEFFSNKLTELSERGLRRELIDTGEPCSDGTRINIEGKEVVNFSSNDYLSLAGDERLKAAAIDATRRYGAGAGAARLITGNLVPHTDLEARIAEFKKAPAALLFSSGYHANIGVIPALATRGDEIFADKLCHASILDGCRISLAEVSRYAHRDSEALERLLKRSTAKKKLIVTDGVFSMDGTTAPLAEIAELACAYNCAVYVDDAHATGVLGPGGRGTAAHFGIDTTNIIEMGTLGKALGSYGAFVCGSRELIDYLKSSARAFIYTTALPPGVAAAASAAIDIIRDEPERREKLLKNSSTLLTEISKLGLDTFGSDSHIVPVSVGTAKNATVLSRLLLDCGYYVHAVRPPTVREGSARLRITPAAMHSEADISGLLSALAEEVMKVPALK